jgi:GNAT superfamily N-acetyltransferase
VICEWWKEDAVTTTKETVLWSTFTLLVAGEVLIREASPEDSERLRRMFSRCSRETIYLRFHLPLTSVPERLIALLAGGTQRGERVLVVASGDEIFGHAMYARNEERDREAEFAVVIEDGWKARGLGTLLLSELTEEARRDGIEALTGISLANNHRLLSLARRVLPGFVCLCSTGTCVIRAPLE